MRLQKVILSVRLFSSISVIFINKKCIDYLSPILAQTIKSEIESVEKNVSEMLFKLAVEQAKLCNVVAATNQIDKVSLSSLNNLCAEEVARNNGIITFEDAYKFQRG